ncbi:MAG: penicillin acylase family protein, partial [Marinicaulis sp.]|nr:penicillin acylase family protein [Marinicaulis sp.]
MKIVKVISIGLVAILAIAAVFLAIWDRPQTPDYKIVLRDDYEITRDDWGVPTIRGETDAAVAYGVALAHAEDDFETIQTKLLAIRGRLGAHIGPEGVKADALSHILRMNDVLDAGYETQLSVKTRAFVEAYADGLNRFAAENKDEILRGDLFPVTGKDVIGGFVYTAPLFFGADEVIGALAVGDLPPNALRDSLPRGSNAFAIAPNRSADGKTWLYSNSHQPWSGPVAWYELRVESGEGWRMYGANFPGGPLPFLGHNDHLGWTNTVNLPDIIDVYKLTTKGKRYKFGEVWRELESKRVWLRVKIGPFTLPVPQTFHWSVHGPAFKTSDGWYAARWPGMNDVHHMESYLALAKSTNYDEFLDALRIQSIPAFNFVYADKLGNIAHIYNASFPDRSPDYDWHGVLPGDDPNALWTDILPFEASPRLENPVAGYIVNANNTPFVATAPEDNLNPDDYPANMGIETRMTNRIIRAVKLLEEIPSISREELDRVKFDVAYDPA